MSEGFPTQTNESLPTEQVYQPQFSKEERVDDYLQAHPNAVQDPREAEVMAHASKSAEEDIVEFMNKAEQAVIDGRPHAVVEEKVSYAELMRKGADKRAQAASNVYRKGEVLKGRQITSA